MDAFAPLSPLAGGALIGLAATLLMAADGRIAGVSGLLAGALSHDDSGRRWKVAFLLGLPLGALAARTAGAELDPIPTGSIPLALGAGLLVGIGTQLGNGCTSGHGVCGIARLSPRSLAATLVFMVVAALTVYLRRHVLGAG